MILSTNFWARGIYAPPLCGGGKEAVGTAERMGARSAHYMAGARSAPYAAALDDVLARAFGVQRAGRKAAPQKMDWLLDCDWVAGTHTRPAQKARRK